MSGLSPLLFVILVTSFVANAHITEVMVDEDNNSNVRSNSIEPLPSEDSLASLPCHVEFQVMKRVVGRCVKLGRNSRGCVAGTYLQPFHPECL